MPKAKVLVVDANQETRAALAHALTDAGYEAAVATSGSFALTMLEWEQPDLIVSYAKVQDMDGYELFTMVRRDPATKDTPFLLLAGRDRPIALAATEAGVDMTVTGDFTLATVMLRVQELLGDTPTPMPAKLRSEPAPAASKAPVKMPARPPVAPPAPGPPPAGGARPAGEADGRGLAKQLPGLARRDGSHRADPGHLARRQDGRAPSLSVEGGGDHPVRGGTGGARRVRGAVGRGGVRRDGGRLSARRRGAVLLQPSGSRGGGGSAPAHLANRRAAPPERGSGDRRVERTRRAGPGAGRHARDTNGRSLGHAQGAGGRRQSERAQGSAAGARVEAHRGALCRVGQRSPRADRARGAGPDRLRRDHAGHGRLSDLRLRQEAPHPRPHPVALDLGHRDRDRARARGQGALRRRDAKAVRRGG